MKLTTRTRYALRALVELAKQPKDTALTLDVIAKRQHVKPKYLEQIFIKLHHAKLIKSKKGPGGGYLLERMPDSIKISEVLAAVGESTAPVLCAEGKGDKYCSGLAVCPMQPYWQKLKKMIDEFFDSTTLYSLCEHASTSTGKKKAKEPTKEIRR